MTAENYSLNNIWLQLVKYQRHICWLIIALLALYLIAFLAELTWRLWPEPKGTQQRIQQSASINQSARSVKTDIAKLQRLNLFGKPGAQPVQQTEQVPEDAPETNLNLTLNGVLAATDPKSGIAIINSQGKQKTYDVDDVIEGTRASLLEVYTDRVIIKNGVRQETLMLDGVDYQRRQQPTHESNLPISVNKLKRKTSNAEQQTNSHRAVLSEKAVAATQNLRNSPMSFSEYFSITPISKEQKLVGYRIRPGRDPSLFRESGMKSGDVITELNGFDLTDPKQAMNAMNELRSADSLQLTVNRNNEMLNLSLAFPQEDDEI